MQFIKRGLIGLFLLGLFGCATQPPVEALSAEIWQDSSFSYQPSRVVETRESLFKLDSAVLQALEPSGRIGYTSEQRLNHLIASLYGPEGIRLAYSAGQTTVASQTWHNKRGDCLSLTVLAYAAARSLGLSAHMQDVRVPVAFDRRGGVDFINGHVNVFVRNDTEALINGQAVHAGGFVIDFEPQTGARPSGTWLSEDAVLARYYNNRGSEYFVQKSDEMAYAYYKAAVATDPTYAPTYTNLALLYVRRGLLAQAERLMRYAVDLGGPSYAPLRSLQQLMTAQGRPAEAQRYAEQLARRQDEDPYYWFGLGLRALQDGKPAQAIASLERAAGLTTGFEEIHYNLALAYWRNGQREAAAKQLATLRAINGQDPGVAVLSKKMEGQAPS